MMFNKLSNALNSLKALSSFKNIDIAAQEAKKKIEGLKSTTLGQKPDEVINGFKSLTSGLANKTVAQITPDVPGLEKELTKAVNDDVKDNLNKITGGSVEDGFLDITITPPTPEGIKASLNTVTPDVQKDFVQIFDGILPHEFDEDLDDIIQNDFSGFTSKFEQSAQEFENNLKTGSSNVTDNVLLNSILENNKLPYAQLSALEIDKATSNEVIKLIDEGKEDEAAALVASKNPNVTKSEAKKVIDTVDLTPSGQTSSENITKKSKIYDTAQNQDLFTEVSSLEELMIELIKCEREMTQVVFFGYTVEEDQFLTAEDINKLEVSIGEEQTNMHYIIRKDGVIQRGRPLTNISNFDPNHNDYSICVGIVHNGENCNTVQAQTVESLLYAFYNICPGGKAFNANFYDNEWEKSGINIDNILKILGKENYGNTSKSLSTKELIEAAKNNIKQPNIE